MIIELLILAALADTPKPPPTVPDAVKAKFFQAQAKMISANAQAMEAQRTARESQATFMQMKQEADKSCGDGWAVNTDGNDDLLCQSMPKPPEKPATPARPATPTPPAKK